MTAEILSRIQFAFTISFYHIFSQLSIGLGLIIIILESLNLRTGNRIYIHLARFWTKIFSLIYCLKAASWIFIEFEFGTNWSGLVQFTGETLGSHFILAGLGGFALESGFLGILIFGWNRVTLPIHLLASVFVTLGAIISSVFLVAANSWMHTPSGIKLVGSGPSLSIESENILSMILNPSAISSSIHVLLAAVISGSFMVLSVSAFYIIKGRFTAPSKKVFKTAFSLATAAMALQLISGHFSLLNTAKYNPEKMASMSGHYPAAAPADMYILGWADRKNKKFHGIKIPGGTSFILSGNFLKHVPGLNSFMPDDCPSAVNTIFYSFQVMISSGIFMLLLFAMIYFYWLKGKLFSSQWILRLIIFSTPIPLLAGLSGWFASEMGRQPWAVYGLLRTSEAVSSSLPSEWVMFSLIMFIAVYGLLLGLFILLFTRRVRQGPYEENPLTSLQTSDPGNG